jgi:hypothetical protein
VRPLLGEGSGPIRAPGDASDEAETKVFPARPARSLWVGVPLRPLPPPPRARSSSRPNVLGILGLTLLIGFGGVLLVGAILALW